MTRISYIGHSAFELSSGEKSILIDPFITGNPVAVAKAEDFSPQTILITHAHNDHVGDSVEISKRTGASVISTFELGEYLESLGANAIPANHGGTVPFDGGTVKFTPAWHTSSYSAGSSTNLMAVGIPAGLIVRFGGYTTYFAGDTALFGDMKLIGEEEIDVAVLPIGDFYTMGPSDAVRAVKLIDPKFVVPCHYNTFPPIKQDVEVFRASVDTQTSARCIPLAPGESFVLP